MTLYWLSLVFLLRWRKWCFLNEKQHCHCRRKTTIFLNFYITCLIDKFLVYFKWICPFLFIFSFILCRNDLLGIRCWCVNIFSIIMLLLRILCKLGCVQSSPVFAHWHLSKADWRKAMKLSGHKAASVDHWADFQSADAVHTAAWWWSSVEEQHATCPMNCRLVHATVWIFVSSDGSDFGSSSPSTDNVRWFSWGSQ